MNYPSLPGIIDLVALQNAIALVLCSDDRLATIPILPEIKFHMDNDITVDSLWSLPRSAIQIKPSGIDLFAVVIDGDLPTVSGPTGAGILVEMPEARVVSRGVTGPPLSWKFRVVCFEDRNINLSAGEGPDSPPVGTFIMAEQLAQVVLDILHQQYIAPYGCLAASVNAIGPATDWEGRYPNIVCYGTTVEVENGRNQTQRSTNVGIAFADGNCAITCADPAAEIRYTLDGTPATKANPSAQIYQGTFPVGTGIVVQASSSKPSLLTSSIVLATAP